jgi:hypothetical protein
VSAVDFLVLFLGAGAGALGGWRIALRHASAAWSGRQRELIDELHYAREAAARATAEAERVTQQAESWAAGFSQGREDVISIMPLLIEHRERAASAPPRVADGSGQA